MLKLLYLYFISITATNMQNDTSDTNKNLQERLWTVTPAPEKTANSTNVTVYLGYANNPFGPSMRFLADKNKKNWTEAPVTIATDLTPPSPPPSSSSPPSTDSKENSVEADQNSQENRSKRGVIHLYNMISCATGCNPIIYKGYGCFCGFLGSGYPVDGIDRCCKKHDWCYNNSNCPTFLEYFVPYYWKCINNRPICGVEHGKWRSQSTCAQRLCQCDKMLSECLSRYSCPSSRALCRSSPLRLLQNALMIF